MRTHKTVTRVKQMLLQYTELNLGTPSGLLPTKKPNVVLGHPPLHSHLLVQLMSPPKADSISYPEKKKKKKEKS